VIALAGAVTLGSAVAAEGTQIVAPTGTLTRAEVQAGLPHSRTTSSLVQLGEATLFIDATGTRSRDEVRAEARGVARSSRGNENHSGS
jgi:hypothetical protein